MAKARKTQRAGAGSNNRELLTWALHGLEQEIAITRERLTTLESHARQLRSASRLPGRATAAGADGADAAPAATGKPVRKRRKLSADARRRIAEAQKRRWAKVKAQA